MDAAAIFPGSEQLALPEHEPERQEDTPEQKALAQLPAGHPLLARAQEALKQQLSATKLRLEEELREKQNTLKVPSPQPSFFQLSTLTSSDNYGPPHPLSPCMHPCSTHPARQSFCNRDWDVSNTETCIDSRMHQSVKISDKYDCLLATSAC